MNSQWLIKSVKEALGMTKPERMLRAKSLGYNIEDLYTHAGGEISEIKKGGYPNLFDGVFASPGKSSMHHSGGKETSFVFKRPVAGVGDTDLDYDKAIATIKKEYPDINDDELDAIYDFSASDKNIFDADLNPFERFGFDDISEASWEAQRLRGRIAAEQDFDAIAMSDEHGVSYLIPAGSKARSVDAAFDPAKKDSPNIMASAAPIAAAGIGGAAMLSPEESMAGELPPEVDDRAAKLKRYYDLAKEAGDEERQLKALKAMKELKESTVKQAVEFQHPLAQEVAQGDGFMGDFGAGFKRGVTELAGGAAQRVGEFSESRQAARLKEFADKINSGEIPATPENIEKFDSMSNMLMKTREKLSGAAGVEGEMRQAFDVTKDRSPVQAIGGNIAGQVAGAMTATPGGVAAIPQTLAGRMGMSTLGGATVGAMQPTINDESVAENTALGGVLGLIAPPALEKAIAPVISKGAGSISNLFKSVIGKSPEQQKIVQAIEKSAGPEQTKAFTAAAEQAKKYAEELADPLAVQADDISRAGKTISKGKVVTDKPAKKLIKQGMNPLTVSLIESSGTADRQAMKRALDILKAGRRSSSFATVNRPGDVAGGLLEKRYNTVKRINRQAGNEIERAAKALEGRPVDISGAYNDFAESLQDLGVSIRRGKKGKLEGVYSNSEFADSKVTQTLINRYLQRSERGTLDAMDAHRLKRVIDGSVEFGKNPNKPMMAKAENLLKGLRKGINERLQELSPAYREANTKFSDTIGDLKEFAKVAGPSFNPLSENADKQLVNMARSIMSNNQKRVPAIDAINALQETAKKYGAKFDDDILKQASFMNDLETLFGSSAPTSFGGQIEKSVEKAIRGDMLGIALEAGKEGVKKVRGINEENLIKALEDLLGQAKPSSTISSKVAVSAPTVKPTAKPKPSVNIDEKLKAIQYARTSADLDKIRGEANTLFAKGKISKEDAKKIIKAAWERKNWVQ